MPVSPPRDPPETLIDAYTLHGRVPLERFFVDDSGAGTGTHYSYAHDEINEYIEAAHRMLRGRQSARLPSTRLWLIEAISSVLAVSSARGLVFGSAEPWVEALLLAAGAANVTTIDYNPLTFEHPDLRTVTAAAFAKDTTYEGAFDLAVAHGAFDHDGLGRYGDRIHPDGDVLAMRCAWRALRPGGLLLLSLPVGPDLIVWNLHRRYGVHRLPRMLSGWHEERRIGWQSGRMHGEGYDHRRRYEPIFVLQRNSSAREPTPGPWPPLFEFETSQESAAKEEV